MKWCQKNKGSDSSGHKKARGPHMIVLMKDYYRTRVRSLFTLVTDSLTHSCLVNLIDVILACEDANSKLVEVVTVADIDAEKCVDDILVQNWKLKFGHKVKFWFRL